MSPELGIHLRNILLERAGKLTIVEAQGGKRFEVMNISYGRDFGSLYDYITTNMDPKWGSSYDFFLTNEISHISDAETGETLFREST
jgi:hypothetical protein